MVAVRRISFARESILGRFSEFPEETWRNERNTSSFLDFQFHYIFQTIVILSLEVSVKP